MVNNFESHELGKVYSVDTKRVTVVVENEDILNSIKINDITLLKGKNADEYLIGLVTKISKKSIDPYEEDIDEITYSYNFFNLILVGTFYKKIPDDGFDIFKRAVNTYPEINSGVFSSDKETLDRILNSVGEENSEDIKLCIGRYASNNDVKAILDGNKFFQRHACIVGSTGSGKSYTVANILEQANKLDYANLVVFDIHGEYSNLTYTTNIKISDNGGLHIPLWFFNYEEIHTLFIESYEGVSTNQRAAVIKYILEEKKKYLQENQSVGLTDDIVTADIPIPFSAKGLIEYLDGENNREESTGDKYQSGVNKGKEKTRQGQYYGKLTNLLTRLKTKYDDKKYSFIFNEEDTLNIEYLNEFIHKILNYNDSKIKVIDLSEIPSDMLSVIIGIVTRLIFDIQFWTKVETKQVRHPVSIICDEAHIYLPRDMSKLRTVESKSMEIFEKIAKEGRKYGIGLVIVSQRPAELNTTIVSQCNNVVGLRIINDRDKAAISSMLTDSFAGLIDMLPNLDIGECMVIGDAIKLPSKIILDKPEECPQSSTIDFWSCWKDNSTTILDIDKAINNMIKQTRD